MKCNFVLNTIIVFASQFIFLLRLFSARPAKLFHRNEEKLKHKEILIKEFSELVFFPSFMARHSLFAFNSFHKHSIGVDSRCKQKCFFSVIFNGCSSRSVQTNNALNYMYRIRHSSLPCFTSMRVFHPFGLLLLTFFSHVYFILLLLFKCLLYAIRYFGVTLINVGVLIPLASELHFNSYLISV